MSTASLETIAEAIDVILAHPHSLQPISQEEVQNQKLFATNRQWISDRRIVSLMAGYKIKDGLQTNVPSIRVGVLSKVPLPSLNSPVPESISYTEEITIPTDVYTEGLETPGLIGHKIWPGRSILCDPLVGLGTLGYCFERSATHSVWMTAGHLFSSTSSNHMVRSPAAGPVVGRLLDQYFKPDKGKSKFDLATIKVSRNVSEQDGPLGELNGYRDLSTLSPAESVHLYSRKSGRVVLGVLFRSRKPIYMSKLGVTLTEARMIRVKVTGRMYEGDSGTVVLDSTKRIIGCLVGIQRNGKLGVVSLHVGT